jgi:hypothetical protein
MNELDLLQQIAVRVPCTTCGQSYEVSLRHVLLSQGMLHEGCPVATETECPPLSYAGLANEAALLQFELAWSRLVDQVRAAGFDLTVWRSDPDQPGR